MFACVRAVMMYVCVCSCHDDMFACVRAVMMYVCGCSCHDDDVCVCSCHDDVFACVRLMMMYVCMHSVEAEKAAEAAKSTGRRKSELEQTMFSLKKVEHPEVCASTFVIVTFSGCACACVPYKAAIMSWLCVRAKNDILDALVPFQLDLSYSLYSVYATVIVLGVPMHCQVYQCN